MSSVRPLTERCDCERAPDWRPAGPPLRAPWGWAVRGAPAAVVDACRYCGARQPSLAEVADLKRDLERDRNGNARAPDGKTDENTTDRT